MNILVANDDGIDARGIHELVRALSTRANVYVMAPESQRSASGHGITISRPIIVEKVDFKNALSAWRISGKPADCVKLGIKILSQENIIPDMVYAGINHGANLGNDTLYSGTVSAALEGSICGIPSVAVSVCSHQAEYFDYACDLALDALEGFERGISSDTILNINVPNAPRENIRGLKCVTLGKMQYREFFDMKELEDGRHQYYYGGEPITDDNVAEGTDIQAIGEGYATITPLHGDLTDYKSMEAIKNRRIKE